MASPPEAIAARAAERLKDRAAPCRGLVTPGQLDLRIRQADRRFWSPQLTVLLEPDGAGGTRLVGTYGPNSEVWTMFMAAYGFVVLSVVTAVFYGSAQLLVGERPWALLAVPIGAALVSCLYVAAGIGQRLGADQTDVLQAFLEEVVGGELGVVSR